MNPLVLENHLLRTRRYFLKSGLNLGGLALSSLALDGLGNPAVASALAPSPAARAKRVIYLHMTGSPPNLDLFDYKPELSKRHGEDCPESFLAGKKFAFTSGTPTLLGTPQKFRQVGSTGRWMSDALPHLQTVSDEICCVHSMHSDQFNHAPAELLMYTGSPRAGRPSMGSWVTYGLGSENADLPAFVVLISSGVQPNGGKSSFGSGFLPSVFQGVQCRSKGDPVLFASDPPGMDRNLRRQTLDALSALNHAQAAEVGNPETQTRISQYELAFRMQVSVPEVMDISQESASTLEEYGAEAGKSSLANNCLLARRLVESGVRFVQLFDWGWDFHGTRADSGIGDGLVKKCESMDRPVAALLRDLKQRGLLEDTLVVWGGEFGRTPFREGRTAKSKILGRDHYPDCYTMWLAGAGVNGGLDYGSTDELGFGVAENPVHVHDLQATILDLLGIDHTRLTYRFQGRDYRLTDVHGEVVSELFT
ncbi:MAG TPA: sulfatase [Planctomycetaceae bacterium]|nr:sulfatase [Planctomycetaceae bacterium]